MRSFIALGLESPPGPSLQGALRALRGFRELSVPRPGNLHVTLVFMGDLAGARVAGAAAAMAAAAGAAGGRWPLTWGTPGAFPSLGKPRVIWLGLADPAMTTTVQRLLVSELRSRAVPVDDWPFLPHLTLARVRTELSREQVAGIKAALDALPIPAPSSVESLVLYRSRPGSGGSAYEELACSPLAG